MKQYTSIPVRLDTLIQSSNGESTQMNSDIRERLISVIDEAGDDPKIAETWYNLGGTLYDRGHIQEAETAFQEALNLDETLVGAWRDLGAALFLQNRHEEAEEA